MISEARVDRRSTPMAIASGSLCFIFASLSASDCDKDPQISFSIIRLKSSYQIDCLLNQNGSYRERGKIIEPSRAGAWILSFHYMWRIIVSMLLKAAFWTCSLSSRPFTGIVKPSCRSLSAPNPNCLCILIVGKWERQGLLPLFQQSSRHSQERARKSMTFSQLSLLPMASLSPLVLLLFCAVWKCEALEIWEKCQFLLSFSHITRATLVSKCHKLTLLFLLARRRIEEGECQSAPAEAPRQNWTMFHCSTFDLPDSSSAIIVNPTEADWNVLSFFRSLLLGCSLNLRHSVAMGIKIAQFLHGMESESRQDRHSLKMDTFFW